MRRQCPMWCTSLCFIRVSLHHPTASRDRRGLPARRVTPPSAMRDAHRGRSSVSSPVPRRVLSVLKNRSAALPSRDAAVKPNRRKRLLRSVLVTGVGVTGAGLAVSSGIIGKHDPASGYSGSAESAALVSASTSSTDAGARVRVVLQDRGNEASRSGSRTSLEPAKQVRPDRRTSVDRVEQRHLDQRSGGQVTRTQRIAPPDPRDVARALLPKLGFSASDYSCLNALYMSESGWDVHADNPSSSAYGIPQALPGSKMASAGPDWENNPTTQIRWGLEYIRASYGTPSGAWSFNQGHGWY